MSELYSHADESYDVLYKKLYMKTKKLTNIYVKSPYDVVENNDPDYDGSYIHLETGHGIILEFEDIICTFVPGNFSLGFVIEDKAALRKKPYALDEFYTGNWGRIVNFETKDHYFMEDYLPYETPAGYYTGNDVNYLKHVHFLFEDGTNLHIHSDYDDLWASRCKEEDEK